MLSERGVTVWFSTPSAISLAATTEPQLVAFPICLRCKRHSLVAASWFMQSLVLALVVGVVAHFAVFGLSLSLNVLHVFLFVVVAIVTFKLLQAAASPLMYLFGRTTPCAASDLPVLEQRSPLAGPILGEKYERTDERALRLHGADVFRQHGPVLIGLALTSPQYAAALVASNGGALPVLKIDSQF